MLNTPGTLSSTMRALGRGICIGLILLWCVACTTPVAINIAERELPPTHTSYPTDGPTDTPQSDQAVTPLATDMPALQTDETSTPTTSPGPTATETPSPAPTGTPCVSSMAYVRDVTIPDDTRFEPGTAFTKTWAIENTGGCPWGEGFSLRLVRGSQMGASDSVPVPTTAPGEIAEVSARMIAPEASGRHTGVWQLSRGDEVFPGMVTVQIVTGGAARIAFTSDVSGENNIHVMDIDGSNWVQLTEGGGFYPSWSPVQQRLAFFSGVDGNMEIYTMNIDGSRRQRLTFDPAWDGMPDWSPDGSKIVFCSERTGSRDLWVMNADGSGVKQLTNEADRWVLSPQWSPDGSKILCYLCQGEPSLGFLVRCVDDLDIWILDPDGSKFRPLLTMDAQYAYGAPTWHPNSRTFAYARLDRRQENGTGWQIYAMDIDGTDDRLIYDSEFSDNPDVWSPDGRQLVFASWVSGYWDLFLLNRESGSVRALTEGKSGQHGHAISDWVE